MQHFESYMSRCLQLARLGEYYVAPNPMVGAVLVLEARGDEAIRREGDKAVGNRLWAMGNGGLYAATAVGAPIER